MAFAFFVSPARIKANAILGITADLIIDAICVEKRIMVQQTAAQRKLTAAFDCSTQEDLWYKLMKEVKLDINKDKVSFSR